MTEVHNPGSMPDPTLIDRIEEPYIRASVITATDYIGPIMTLCLGKRGELVKQEYIPAIAWRYTMTCRWAKSSSTSTTS